MDNSNLRDTLVQLLSSSEGPQILKLLQNSQQFQQQNQQATQQQSSSLLTHNLPFSLPLPQISEPEEHIIPRIDPENGGSYPCGNCKFCSGVNKRGGFETATMILKTKVVTSKITQETYPIQQVLNCENQGFMIIECKQPNCQHQYLSFTGTSYRTKLHNLAHEFKTENRKHPLKNHYVDAHPEIEFNGKIDECFQVIFIEHAVDQNLRGIQEKWRNRLKPSLGVSVLGKGKPKHNDKFYKQLLKQQKQQQMLNFQNNNSTSIDINVLESLVKLATSNLQQSSSLPLPVQPNQTPQIQPPVSPSPRPSFEIPAQFSVPSPPKSPKNLLSDKSMMNNLYSPLLEDNISSGSTTPNSTLEMLASISKKSSAKNSNNNNTIADQFNLDAYTNTPPTKNYLNQNLPPGSHACNSCRFCTKKSVRGRTSNMDTFTTVLKTNVIKSSHDNSEHPITQALTCRNYGFMALQCKVDGCHQQFLCYTKTSFKQRLHSLTHDFKIESKVGGHQLKKHYYHHHKDIELSKNISDCYYAIFLEEPSEDNSNESIQMKWCRLLKPAIGSSGLSIGQKILTNRQYNDENLKGNLPCQNCKFCTSTSAFKVGRVGIFSKRT